RSAVKNGARDKEQGTREKEQFRTPLRYRFVANYEPEKLFVLAVVSPSRWFVVRHEAKHSAVKNGTKTNLGRHFAIASWLTTNLKNLCLGSSLAFPFGS
ncbi:MAG: hypothetical protein N2381_11120, partial [Armatimonadetes bacterium]|nr:hypothetical protein [Armatimonadota bacterium]